ncbi:hypothetical protein QBC35DRAFT_475534 [Podospora australis]|uniref:Uncharacterized protein n=1 Tax=Podospora australis TaxID=1536484 RepID=A0AAN6WTT9_9PEZI|nr:hypothetical protein QBC35DRAFT_475534 [Podospora australis]
MTLPTKPVWERAKRVEVSDDGAVCEAQEKKKREGKAVAGVNEEANDNMRTRDGSELSDDQAGHPPYQQNSTNGTVARGRQKPPVGGAVLPPLPVFQAGNYRPWLPLRSATLALSVRTLPLCIAVRDIEAIPKRACSARFPSIASSLDSSLAVESLGDEKKLYPKAQPRDERSLGLGLGHRANGKRAAVHSHTKRTGQPLFRLHLIYKVTAISSLARFLF